MTTKENAAGPCHGETAQDRLHGMTAVPPGATLADVLPAFVGVKHEVIIGTPNQECASCRKPFNEARKRRKILRMSPAWITMPVVFSFHICGRCLALHQKGGAARDGVLVAVQAYCEGIEATQ